MKGIFNDPIRPGEKKAESKNFDGPSKLDLTVNEFMAAGDNYGTGFGPKTGTMKATGDSACPKGAHKMSPRSLA